MGMDGWMDVAMVVITLDFLINLLPEATCT